MSPRVAKLVTAARMSDQAAAIGRLFLGVTNARTATIDFEIAGGIGGAWTEATTAPRPTPAPRS